MELHLDLTKWFQKEKDHISSLRNQERPLSFLKGRNGDTKEMGHFSRNLKIYMELREDITKWFQKEKDHISSLRSQEHPLSFLKGRNGNTKETGHFLTL